ncbi:MAG: T9SS type A sorting domain-containing protein [Chitinophagales bacterium]|nr:T9SS type A sorting domain-containing protein [Chitinophagales bacterium]
MKKILTVFCIALYSLNLISQTAKDTVDYPYWMEMMFDRNINFYKTKRAFDLYFSNKPKEKGTGFKQFERWAENAKREINEDGSFRPADFLLKELANYKTNALTPRSGNPKWTSLGPFNNPAPASMQRGVGRVNVIAFHPNDPSIIYCGAPAGGFWYTKDKAQSWTKSNTDDLPRFGVSAIAVIPEGNSTPIILVGTGDRDANDAPGYGVYVSLDGGINFTPSNTGMGNQVVNRLLVNAQDNNVIIAATDNGIFKSYDKGQSWTRTSQILDFKDVVYHPEDTNFVYAAANGNFYRSINGGNTWTQISAGFSSASKRRMAIAVTKAKPDIVYVIAVNSNRGMEGLYKSSNKGANFTLQLNGTTFNPLSFAQNGSGTSGQGEYDLAIESSPNDSNVLYVGGINVFRSVDGGKTFRCKAFWSFSATIPWVHADIHYLGRNPINGELWIGSDGGIDYSADEKLPTSGTNDPFFPVINNRNSGLAISQFYNLGVSQASLTKFITGAQDNGTSAGTNKSDWTAELGGDGMQCEISNFNTDIMFGCIQYGDMNRSTNSGGAWNNIVSSINERPGPWVTPYHLHPRVDNILVAIYRNVWISRNATGTGNPSFTRITTTAAAEGSALRFSNVNNNYVFCGWKDGVLRYSTNILASNPTFTGMNSPSVSGEITDIETSYYDVNTLYVAKGNRIFRSRDLGATWTNISGNLPNIAINCIALDKNASEGLYVGTEAGVYFKDSTMTNWIMYSDGLSLNAPVRDMEIVYDTDCSANSKIFAATYGRGLWLNIVQVTSNGSLELNSDKGNQICKGEKIELTASGAVEYFFDASPDIKKSNSNTFTITPDESKQYRFYAKKSDGTCESKMFDVTVNPLPVLDANPRNKTINKGESVTITASGADEYSWSPNTFIQSGLTSKNLSVRPDNTITYTLTGKTSKGCQAILKITITVNGSNSITNASSASVQIYPNPASNELTVKSDKKTSYRLIDMQGRMIFSENQEKYYHQLHIEDYPAGIYILEVTNSEGRTESHKFKIEK